MSRIADVFEELFAGDTVSIENTDTAPLSISLVSDNGCHVETELMPGQAMAFSTGTANAKIHLLKGNPASLLVIRPEAAS